MHRRRRKRSQRSGLTRLILRASPHPINRGQPPLPGTHSDSFLFLLWILPPWFGYRSVFASTTRLELCSQLYHQLERPSNRSAYPWTIKVRFRWWETWHQLLCVLFQIDFTICKSTSSMRFFSFKKSSLSFFYWGNKIFIHVLMIDILMSNPLLHSIYLW